MNKLQDFIKSEYLPLKKNPALVAGFRVGDTVKVHQLIKEIITTKKALSKTAKKALEKSSGGDKGPVERIQVFEGVVIAKKHGTEPGATFTVRKLSGGIAVEKIYPLYSTTLKKIEVVAHSKVRKAKLYHLRNRFSKAAKRVAVEISTETTDSSKSNN